MDPASLLGGLGLDSEGFKQLLDNQSLVDCTLACDGGKIFAHKVVLSACSSYLAKILQEHPAEHPIIILPELNIEDVKTLIHYMYTGELLKSETLNSASLLRTAAILSVNSLNDFLNSTSQAANHLALGLSSLNNNNNNNINSNDFNSPDDTTPNLPYQMQLSHSSNPLTSSLQYFNSIINQSQNNAIKARGNLDNEPFLTTNNISTNTTDSLATIVSQSNNSSVISSKSSSSNLSGNSLNLNFLSNSTSNTTKMLNGVASVSRSSSSSSDFQFKCPVCHNDFQTVCSFEYHMQRTHQVTSFGCEICHKPFASLRYVLTDHMRRCHGWKAEQKLHY